MRVIIAGGGSAGWITASTLIKAYPGADITVIEASNIPVIGVGESAIQSIRELLDFLELEDKDWMQHCNAIYKGSIDFTGWGENPEERVKEPFGAPLEPLGLGGTFNFWDWNKKKYLLGAEKGEFHNFIVDWGVLLDSNKVTKEHIKELGGWDFKKCTSFHLDAGLFAEYLKNYFCKPRGVKHIIGEIGEVHKSKGDMVEHITLKNGVTFSGDIYIDCTGFRRVLINEVGGVCDSFEDTLINDRAVATRMPYIDKEAEMQFNTNATTLDNGWVWNIPLWNRIGSGYVYSSKFLTKQEAEEELKQYLTKTRSRAEVDSLDYLHVEMSAELLKEPFIGNVCSIGLSQGFVEPLGSTGLHLIIIAARYLVSILSDRGGITSIERGLFNKYMKDNMYLFKNIISARYALSRRTDTEYWNYIHSIDYIAAGTLAETLNSVKDPASSRMLGTFEFMLLGNMGVSTCSPLTPFTQEDLDMSYRLKEALEVRKREQLKVVECMPSLFEFMREHIYNRNGSQPANTLHNGDN
jgi:tryptophan halogenase